MGGVGGGVSDSHNFHSVSSLAVLGNDLYVGGYFTGAGGIEANGIAKWDGTKWSTFGGGIKLDPNSNLYDVRAVAVSGEDVYIGGKFLIADSDTVNNIAKWNGTKWVSMGGGIKGSVYKIVATGNAVYVGGSFSKAGDISVNNIAKWDGTNWSSLGGGVNGPVFDIKAYKYAGTILVGGRFNNAGGTLVNNIAQFTDSDNPLSVERLSSEIPTNFSLKQNYPNPFNPSTKIQFSLPSSSHVTLNIFNLLGEQISVLVNKKLSAGTYNYSWNAENLSSGIYIFQLKAGNFVSQRKMVFLK